MILKSKKRISVPKCLIEKNFSLTDADIVKINKNELLKLGEE